MLHNLYFQEWIRITALVIAYALCYELHVECAVIKGVQRLVETFGREEP